MHFPFHIPKATEVAAAFLKKAGGELNAMKLVKLIYLVDRLSFQRRGIPIVGGVYLSMKNGPVTSQVLDLINAGRLYGDEDETWEKTIGARQNHTVSLASPVEAKFVSEVEQDMISEVWTDKGEMDQWALSDWCHEHCPEWTELDAGNEPISLEQLAGALEKNPEQRERVLSEARELSFLDSIFR